MEDIALKKLSLMVEGHNDFSKVFGLSENPIMEKNTIKNNRRIVKMIENT